MSWERDQKQIHMSPQCCRGECILIGIIGFFNELSWGRDISKEAFEPWHGISNNVVCATSKASVQPVHTHSLVRAFTSR